MIQTPGGTVAGRLRAVEDDDALYWAGLVELYEYKVEDLLAGRRPRGGRRSLGDLRDLLKNAPLERILMRRFTQTDRLWRAHLRDLRAAQPSPGPVLDPAQEPPAFGTVTPSLTDILASVELALGAFEQGGAPPTTDHGPALAAPAGLADSAGLTGSAALTGSAGLTGSIGSGPEKPAAAAAPLTTPHDPLGLLAGPGPQAGGAAPARRGAARALPTAETEARAARQLGELHWRGQLRQLALEALPNWQREPDLVTLRAASAFVANMERGEHVVAVPRLGDPLIDLHDGAVARTLTAELADLVWAALTEADPAERRAALARLRAGLVQLADQPFPRHPDQDVVHARIAAARQQGPGQGVSPQETRAFVQELEAQTGGPRSATERPAIREAAGRLHELLVSLVPQGDGGRGPQRPAPPHLLFAVHPQHALPLPDQGSETLALRLSERGETSWRGFDLRWRPEGRGYLLSCGGYDYRLLPVSPDPEYRGRPGTDDPDGQLDPVQIPFGASAAQALLWGDYLHLWAPFGRDRTLERLLVLARLVSLLIDPGGAYLNLRLARALVQQTRSGQIDPAVMEVSSAERYAAASPDALLSFARKGAESLIAALRPRAAADLARLLSHAGGALEVPRPRLEAFLAILSGPLSSDDPPPVPRLSGTLLDESQSTLGLEFVGEPVTVSVMNRAVTLRLDYKNDLAAVVPGLAPALLRDLLVIDMPSGGVLLARQGQQLLVGYQPHLSGL